MEDFTGSSEFWDKQMESTYKKKKDSRKLDQFRPISLLNVEGKIFFVVIAKRIRRFMIYYGYVNILKQKAGIPGFPGCIEHTTMLWDRIKTVKNKKSADMAIPQRDVNPTKSGGIVNYL